MMYVFLTVPSETFLVTPKPIQRAFFFFNFSNLLLLPYLTDRDPGGSEEHGDFGDRPTQAMSPSQVFYLLHPQDTLRSRTGVPGPSLPGHPAAHDMVVFIKCFY